MGKSAIVIGAGIVGLATARALAEGGYSVTVIERNERAIGASIRNFGMVWPIGQPLGLLYDRAMRSRNIWKQISDESNIWSSTAGSLLTAYHADELACITEFYEKEKSNRPIKLLNAKDTLAISPATNPTGLLAGLWSETELIVDPRQAIAQLPAYLTAKYGIQFKWNTAITGIDHPTVFYGKESLNADVKVMILGNHDKAGQDF